MLRARYPLSTNDERLITDSRQTIANILHGRDSTQLVVVGPCSIHDPKAGIEYAERLAALAEELRDKLCVVMRVYFEKPRTTVGWKGLINDPHLDGSFKIEEGLAKAREFLLGVVGLGLPTATEFLDTTFGQYYTDLISLGAIGARTTESQVHRELASGLSMPVGFKNRTDGDIGVARDAILAASAGHSFPTLTTDGKPAILETAGNPDCFLILRGGSAGPNYEPDQVSSAEEVLAVIEPKPAIVVDCSHGNSRKDHARQAAVIDSVCEQLLAGNQSIKGVMLESHLKAGNQPLRNPADLEYGKSITDACIDWPETDRLLRQLAAAV